MPLNECKLINIPKIDDLRGSLAYIQYGKPSPFEFKRVYYLFDIPGGSVRGSHAHRKLEQFIICLSGSFDVVLDDGIMNKRFTLNRAHQGLYVCPMIWRNLDNFSSGSVCLVLASELYIESDYIRDYETFLQLARK